jgi:outer membrane protein
MNKYISIGFNIVLSIAVAVLYYLHFGPSSKAPSASTSAFGSDSVASTAVVIPESEIRQSGIVFVNTDTLLKYYDYYNVAKKNFEARQKKAQTTLTNQYAAFQQEAMAFQKKAQEGGYSPEEGAQKEQELQLRQQQLMQDKETQMSTLMADEQKISEKLYKDVQAYVKRFSHGKTYQYVLGYTGSTSNILFKNDSLDITQPILKGLNEEYRKK